jgi:NADH:ubiquinone oxidoreductase subunit 3 (subunit A)
LIIEATVAFVLIISATLVVYLLGRRVAPKPIQTEAELTAYACGEKVTFPQLRVNVSLYKYLIYFVVLDSSVILIAFAAFTGLVNVPLVMVYLFMMLCAGLLLVDGGKE